MSCGRRVTKAAKACVGSSGSGRGSGRITSANRTNTWASMASVLARCPVALEKSRTWRGLTTTLAPQPEPMRSSGKLQPPVASGTLSSDRRDVRDPGLMVRDGGTRAWTKGNVQLFFRYINSEDWDVRHHCLLGRPALRNADSWALATVRALQVKSVATHAVPRPRGPRLRRSITLEYR